MSINHPATNHHSIWTSCLVSYPLPDISNISTFPAQYMEPDDQGHTGDAQTTSVVSNTGMDSILLTLDRFDAHAKKL